MLVAKDRMMTGTEARSWLGDLQAKSAQAKAAKVAQRVELLSERFEKLVRVLPRDAICKGMLLVDIADALSVTGSSALSVMRAAGWWYPHVEWYTGPGRWFPPWAPAYPGDSNIENVCRVRVAAPEWWDQQEVWSLGGMPVLVRNEERFRP